MMDLDAENETQLILPFSKKSLGDYKEILDSIKAETYTEPESSALNYLHGTTIAVAKTKHGIFIAADGMLYERCNETDVAIDYKYDKFYDFPNNIVATAAGNVYFVKTVLEGLKRLSGKIVKRNHRHPTDALANGCLELMRDMCRQRQDENEKLAPGEERTYYQSAIIIAGFDYFKPRIWLITVDMEQLIDNVPVKTKVPRFHVDGLGRELKNFMWKGYSGQQAPKDTKALLISVMVKAYKEGFCGGVIRGYWFRSGKKITQFDAHVDKLKCWFRPRVKKTILIDDHIEKFYCAENRKSIRMCKLAKLKETQIASEDEASLASI